ncbi:DUF4129 domain-containing protein [Microbacterium amylolyticum]|uniref:Protein-glutamine gamma-glutamyltransferase-like C-terminal domain-containing protein n=1 Tax=Microbacterium amylolyticum TaxID=936337 RepID=A0ABS4ZKL4_9MICO|nr:DUF4129 domain-containing protein [Microbacterium amylolyticum]MBP2437833.1 hypothetical protein [Microbacterium amylolyticum]
MATDDDRLTVRRGFGPVLVVGLIFGTVAVASARGGRPEVGDALFHPPTGDEPPEGEVLPAVTMSPSFEYEVTSNEVPSSVMLVLAVLAGLALVVVLFSVARALLRQRPRARQEGIAIDDELTPVVAEARMPVSVPAIRRGIEGALARLDDDRPTSDAIIAAWVGLEESADDAGQSRGISETAGEFTSRILQERPGAEADIRSLLFLYESVRFGGVTASDADRTAARAALERIREAWS